MGGGGGGAGKVPPPGDRGVRRGGAGPFRLCGLFITGGGGGGMAAVDPGPGPAASARAAAADAAAAAMRSRSSGVGAGRIGRTAVDARGRRTAVSLAIECRPPPAVALGVMPGPGRIAAPPPPPTPPDPPCMA